MTTDSIPRALPLLDHAQSLLRDPLTFLKSLPAHGVLVENRVGTFKAAVVCDPELTRQVHLDHRTYDRGGPVHDRGTRRPYGLRMRAKARKPAAPSGELSSVPLLTGCAS